MKNKNYLAPIIIIGAHRSGTSMICRFLENTGVFMGRKKESNNESIFFQDLNHWILNASSARWDSPENIEYLFANKEIFDLTVDYLKQIVNSPHIKSYLGFYKYLKNRSLTRLNFSWGWKDPRNTYTLPIWLEIFPQAKIIHVYRHGIDVANSLIKRNNNGVSVAKHLHGKRKHLYNIVKKKGGFTDGILCSKLEGGFNLWEKYIRKSFELESKIHNKFLNIRYEDFLYEPEKQLIKILDFCHLNVDSEKIKQVCQSVNKNRSFAYREDKKLVEFSEIVKDRLSNFNY
jgi:hypothetical protein